MFSYTVSCRFAPTAREVVEPWLNWLRREHLADVCAAGARSAVVVRLDESEPGYEIRYEFESREAFERYEADHAPRLRAEGLSRFPLDLGLKYTRQTGEILETFRPLDG
jgi:hypothetical protein